MANECGREASPREECKYYHSRDRSEDYSTEQIRVSRSGSRVTHTTTERTSQCNGEQPSKKTPPFLGKTRKREVATETTDLVSGGGGAEDEALGEAPPREPSSVPALRNASLQRHAKDDENQQQPPRQFHGVYSLHLSLSLEQKMERDREIGTSKESPSGGRSV